MALYIDQFAVFDDLPCKANNKDVHDVYISQLSHECWGLM